MLKLEVDWANEQLPELGQVDEHVRVEVAREHGPAAGWPVLAVYATVEAGEPAYMAAMRLQGWVQDVYLAGMPDDERLAEAEELMSWAEEV